MGLLTFSINVTLDGCIDHEEGIVDDETHAHFTRLLDESGAMLWGRTTYELMEDYWPAVARGDEDAPAAMREWALKLETKPKYVVSTTRTDFPWTNSHHVTGDLGAAVRELKHATPHGAPRQRVLGHPVGPAESHRRLQIPGAPPDRGPRPDAVCRWPP